MFLLAHDTDPFCRWEAGQSLLRGLLTSLYTAASASKVPRGCFLTSSHSVTSGHH